MTTENFLLASLMVCGVLATYPLLGTDPLRDSVPDDGTDGSAHCEAGADEAVGRAILLAATI
jgi:hypothetical protein